MPHEREHNTGPAVRSSKALLFVMFGIILLGILAFVVFKPNPSSVPTHTPASQQQ